MYLKSRIEEVVSLLVPERHVALPPPLDETGQIIMKAADLIRQRGWATGSFFLATGAMCAMGALYMAINGCRSSADESHPAIQRVIRYLGGGNRGAVENWNDTRCHSAGECIAMLESAARFVR